MTILSDEDIDVNCKHVVAQLSYQSPFIQNCMNVLYNCGCRASESVNMLKWSELDNSNLKLVTLKYNYERTIEKAILPVTFVTLVLDPEKKEFYCSASNLRKTFEKLTLYPNARVLNKQISLHMFRHNFVKQLYSNGASVDEIEKILGLKSSDIVNNYLHSVIYIP